MTDNPEQRVAQAVTAVGEIMKVAKESPEAREAGVSAAKSLKIIADTVHTVLLPLAAANYGAKRFADYMTNRFGPELAEKTKGIPPEDVVPPTPSVAGPVLDALVYAHGDDDLRALYLQLLATAMDGRHSTAAHPAFVEVLRAISPAEILLLRSVFTGHRTHAIVELRKPMDDGPAGAWVTLETNLLNYLVASDDGNKPVEKAMGAAYVDNWVRLRLVSVDFGSTLARAGAYDWVVGRPEYARLAERHALTPIVQRGVLEVTPWGEAFARAVGITPSPQADG